MKHKSLNQLLCAATVNVRFREVLLRDPAKAIATGYFDHSFALTPEETELVCGIQAKGLEDFAAQVYHWISGAAPANGHNGNGQHRSSQNAAVMSGRYGYNGLGRNGHNGNGHNGNGHKQDLLTPADGTVDLYCAPALAHA